MFLLYIPPKRGVRRRATMEPPTGCNPTECSRCEELAAFRGEIFLQFKKRENADWGWSSPPGKLAARAESPEVSQMAKRAAQCNLPALA